MVTVITSLDPLRHHPITATERGAIVAAFIVVDAVAVVAGLATFPNLTIAAARDTAVVEATIGLNLIAIIALLDIEAQNAITTACRLAAVGAGIRIIPIGIIALLAFINLPIAAALEIAGRRTTIARIAIAIIAFFKALIVRPKVAAADTIAAARHVARA